MLAIAVEFLTERFVATAAHHRDESEWPPHPARLFSALVATWADADPPDDRERAVLEWLEALPAPRIHASDGDVRRPMTHFVPINDASVVGLSLQERRYGRLQGHLDALDEALEHAGGDLDAKKVVRAQAKVDKERDVERQVGAAGNTPVEAALRVLPEGRGRQPRTYPSVTPHEPTVVYEWPDAQIDAAARGRLDGLLARVVRLGHSSSFVSCRLVEPPAGAARYVPDDRRGAQDLRSVGPGQLAALERAFARHGGSRPRSLPHRAARYADRDAEPEPALAPSSVMSGDLIVFRRTGGDRSGGRRSAGDRYPIIAAVGLTRALRGALMAHAEEPVCEELSGHVSGPDGEATAPVQRPHAAFLALPFVGRTHATGSVMGVGVLLPAGISGTARAAVLGAIGRWERERDRRDLRLELGRQGVMHIARVADLPDSDTLKRRTWARPSARWATVTPIALDRHPGDLWGSSPRRVSKAFAEAEASIVRACSHVGLPEPAAVEVTLQPLVVGSRPARAFPRFVQGRGRRRVQRALAHARVTFREPVGGPLLLGAGRYLGLGLLRPVDEPQRESEG